MNGLLKHTGYIFLLALAALAAAVGLHYAEQLLEHINMPHWMVVLTRFISMALFTFDGILVVGTAAITTLKALRGLLNK